MGVKKNNEFSAKKKAVFQIKKEQHFHGAKYSQRAHRSVKDYNRKEEKDIRQFLEEE